MLPQPSQIPAEKLDAQHFGGLTLLSSLGREVCCKNTRKKKKSPSCRHSAGWQGPGTADRVSHPVPFVSHHQQDLKLLLCPQAQLRTSTPLGSQARWAALTQPIGSLVLAPDLPRTRAVLWCQLLALCQSHMMPWKSSIFGHCCF